jgi:tetratricopeptide (TPR) repeat protein
MSDTESRMLQRHLLTCQACEVRLISLLPAPQETGRGFSEEAGYRRIVRELLDDTRSGADRRQSLLLRERSEAEELWRKLEGKSFEEARGLVRSDPEYWSWGFFERLFEEGRHSALVEPRRSEEQLRLALEITDHLDPEIYGPGLAEAAKTRAWAYLGNSLRILSDFRRAERAFQMAELFFSQSWLDPLDEALLLELKSSLRRAQRRFDESLRLLDDAILLYRELNETHLEGRTLMLKGLVLQYTGDFPGATTCFRESLSLLDEAEEPRLAVACRFNLVHCLYDSGHAGEAAVLIPEARTLMEQFGTRSDLLHLRWLEGAVAAALEKPAEAEQAFLEVKEAFTTDLMAFDAALVTLELASLYSRQGRTAEVKQLVEEIIPIFQSCEVPQEALAALIVLRKAAEMEQLTLSLVEEVASFLEKVRVNPTLRFRENAEA